MATKQKHKLSRAARQEERAGLLFILAPIVGFLCFMLFPICFSIVLSFQSWTGIGEMRFVGFQHCIELFTTDTFWYSLGNTFFYLIGIPIGMVIALFLAMGMNRKIPGVRILRTAYYVPVVSSLVAVAVLWNQIYTQNGLLNNVLHSLFGIDGPAWLYDAGTVKWVYYIYDVTFNQMAGARMGYGAAISWILTIIILIVTLIQFKVQNRWVYSAE